jgi:hypothetical protein
MPVPLIIPELECPAGGSGLQIDGGRLVLLLRADQVRSEYALRTVNLDKRNLPYAI